MFDTGVTLKHSQGHWKWYEQVKLNGQHHCAKFDFGYIYGVRENHNIQVFDNPNTQTHIFFMNQKQKTSNF